MGGGCCGQTAAPAACQQTVSMQPGAELLAPGKRLHSRKKQRQPQTVSQVLHTSSGKVQQSFRTFEPACKRPQAAQPLYSQRVRISIS